MTNDTGVWNLRRVAMVWMACVLMAGPLVSPVLAEVRPAPSAYGHAFWNPPLKGGSYDDLAAFITRFFPNETVGVTAHEGKSTLDIQPSGNSSIRVTVGTVRGPDESFVQKYRESDDPSNGATWLAVAPNQLRPTVDVPGNAAQGNAGRGVILLGPPGAVPLNGSSVEEKARAFAREAGSDRFQVGPVNQSGAAGPIWIYHSFWQCPSSNASFCGTFRAIVLTCHACSNVIVDFGTSNATEWYKSRFNTTAPRFEGDQDGWARLMFYHGDLVAAVVTPGYQLNVSSMLSRAAAEDRIVSYFGSKGYGVDRPDLSLGPAISPEPVGSRTFNVTSTAYTWFGVYLYNLTLAHRLYGDGPIPSPGVGRPAHIQDPTLRELYTKTDLYASVYQDTVTGAVTNITYTHWVNSSGPAHLGDTPSPWSIPSIGLPGLVTAMAVALVVRRRRRGG